MNYKSLFLIILVPFALISKSKAQEKVKKFCVLSCESQSLNSKGNNPYPTIDFGQTKKYSPLKDSTATAKLNRVETIDNFVKAMNYMTELGWKYEGNVFIYEPSNPRVSILFSKEFYPAELTEVK